MKYKLSKLEDGALFRLSLRKNAAAYTLNTKKKGNAVITSVSSGKTYTKPGKTVCYL